MSRGYDGLFGPPFYGRPFAPPRRPARAPMRRGEPPAPLTGFDRPVDPTEEQRIPDEARPDEACSDEPCSDEPRSDEDRVVPLRPAAELDDQAERVARDAIERAQAKLKYDAELARAKHRFEREAAREVEQRRREIIAPFLDVLDDMNRALAAAGDESPELRRGIELVRDNFLAKLRDQGVAPMDVEGERFDPERHEAMSMVPVEDPALDNRIVAVLRGGYEMGDEVLRPAGVAVGRAA